MRVTVQDASAFLIEENLRALARMDLTGADEETGGGITEGPSRESVNSGRHTYLNWKTRRLELTEKYLEHQNPLPKHSGGRGCLAKKVGGKESSGSLSLIFDGGRERATPSGSSQGVLKNDLLPCSGILTTISYREQLSTHLRRAYPSHKKVS